jgi:uncharacterized membrane protein YhhN
VLSSPSIVCILVTALGVVTTLAASRARMPRAYALSKAVASLGFVATALSAGATAAVWSRVALGALVLAAIGDVALAVPGSRGFLVGLGSFAGAHSVFAAAFAIHGTGGAILGGTAAVATAFSGGAWLWLRHRLPRRMRVPVGVYAAIVASMLATGAAAGISHRAWLLALGVVLVAGSDIAVGRERFGRASFANKLVGLPAYYAGQTLIALSLAMP